MKLLSLIIAILFTTICNAQKSVIRSTPEGNFVQVSIKDTTVSLTANCVKTPKTFTALDGTVYPVYLSTRGSLFILRKSAKTGKEYKQYLNNIK